jgi:hypothetical protein
MTFLTVFSAPKPFTNPHINIIQRNAMQSWQHLGPQVQAFLVGQEAGLAEAALDYHMPVLADVQRNDSGTPLVSSIFSLARQASDSPFLVCVNGDILLLPDILQAAKDISQSLPAGQPFLMIGQRWDLDVPEMLDFSSGWDERLRTDIHLRGRLHPPAGSDYFLFPRSAFSEMPDFAIGRAGWDNWMIYHARQQRWPVIDGTPSVTIVHQSHDYSHLPGNQPHYNLPESQHNMALAGGAATMFMVLDTDRQLSDGRVMPHAWSLVRSARAIERWLTPPDGKMRGLRGSLARRARRLRRRLSHDSASVPNKGEATVRPSSTGTGKGTA